MPMASLTTPCPGLPADERPSILQMERLRLLSPQDVAGLGLDTHTWPQRGWVGYEPPWELRCPRHLTVQPGVWLEAAPILQQAAPRLLFRKQHPQRWATDAAAAHTSSGEERAETTARQPWGAVASPERQLESKLTS